MVRVDYKQCCVDRPITDPYKGLLHLQSIIKNCFKLKLISEEGRVPLSCHRPSALAHVAVVAVVVVAAVVVVLVTVVGGEGGGEENEQLETSDTTWEFCLKILMLKSSQKKIE